MKFVLQRFIEISGKINYFGNAFKFLLGHGYISSFFISVNFGEVVR